MLRGRTALVTGSTGPIGDAIAARLAARGSSVMIHGLGDAEALEHRCGELRELYGVGIAYSDADLADPEGVSALVSATREQLGEVDVLVNAAGVQHTAPLDEFPRDRLRAILDINLLATIVSTQLVLPAMKARGWGRIVNMASANGVVSSPLKVPYSASKHGVIGLTKGTALEAGAYGVTCNALAPGFVDTPMFHGPSADLARREGVEPEVMEKRLLQQKHVTGELITGEEIAETVLFLCSPAARNITGAVLSIDGGWTAH